MAWGPYYASLPQRQIYPAPGNIFSVVVTAGGTGYSTAPTVAIAGAGTGATATATISGGAVTAVTVTAQGTGYTTGTTISFSGGGGSGATAVANSVAIIDQAHWDATQNNFVNWGGNVNGGGYTLSNVVLNPVSISMTGGTFPIDIEGGALGSSIGSLFLPQRWGVTDTDTDYLEVFIQRTSVGSTHASAQWGIQRMVNASVFSAIEWGAGGTDSFSIFNGGTEYFRFVGGQLQFLNNASTLFPPSGATLINGNNNNVTIPAGQNVTFSGPTAAYTLTGIVAGVAGATVLAFNATAYAMSITNNDTNSSAGNRFSTTGGVTKTVPAYGYVHFQYGPDAYWHIISISP